MSGSLGWIFLAVALYGLVHSVLASHTAKILARRWFGPGIDRYYRLFYNLVAFLTLLPVLALTATLPDRILYVIPFPWAILLVIIQVLAALGLLTGLIQTGVGSFIGLRQLVDPTDDKPSHLVVGGLYRWVRHPLYTAGLLILWLMPLMTINILALNLGLSLYILIGLLFEERKLLREYGQSYSQYRDQTPMLIPGLKRRSPDRV